MDLGISSTQFQRLRRVQKLASRPQPMWFYNQRKRITALALTNRLPSIFHNEELVKVGGLLSYGANVPAIFRHSAVYADKIIKGAKATDLPVEAPVLFRMFVNLQTAKALGLTADAALGD